MYRYCRGNEAIGDIVGVAFAVVSIEKPNGSNIKPHPFTLSCKIMRFPR